MKRIEVGGMGRFPLCAGEERFGLAQRSRPFVVLGSAWTGRSVRSWPDAVQAGEQESGGEGVQDGVDGSGGFERLRPAAEPGRLEHHANATGRRRDRSRHREGRRAESLGARELHVGRKPQRGDEPVRQGIAVERRRRTPDVECIDGDQARVGGARRPSSRRPARPRRPPPGPGGDRPRPVAGAPERAWRNAAALAQRSPGAHPSARRSAGHGLERHAAPVAVGGVGVEDPLAPGEGLEDHHPRGAEVGARA